MKEIICEMCGSNDIVKKEGVYVCQSCGTKYTPEEAKKLMVEGTVTIDKSSEKENLKTLAKRYYDNEEFEKADDYYDRIIELDPHDWEAVYYGGLASAKRSTFDNIRLGEAVIGAENAIHIMEDDEKEKYSKIFREELLTEAIDTTNFVFNVADENFSDFGADAVGGYLNNLVDIITDFEKILEKFPEKKVTKNGDSWNAYIHIIECANRLQRSYSYYWGYNTSSGAPVHKPFESSQWKSYGKSKQDEYTAKLQALDPEFMPPEVPNDGCYVATCVYQSYDCPEVWTLRRFRDNTLRKSIFGRTFIKCYYVISPTIVKFFGDYKIFNLMFKPILDKFVNKLQEKGFESTFYSDMGD
ncbi:MAG: hypothetical protein E7Z73_01785 [Methanobrevibacter millerae]|uniref:Uncharacterized protein n=1 Tax=Methanobrevibacter millerae TaxID=230361 RepID=A0A8T3VGK3_9EURY|nr:CFI-box-CTERM domain-containing protein [Methanobrevibacter millerae]MBE6504463.1 hypothetical protein [Methanobrevibacter millerae]